MALIVFVDFYKKAPSERPDFYILTFRDWKALIRKRYNECPPGSVELTPEFTMVWNEGKYVGVGVRPAK